MTELADVFADLDDPRAVNARRHSLHDILSWSSPHAPCSAAARPVPIRLATAKLHPAFQSSQRGRTAALNRGLIP